MITNFAIGQKYLFLAHECGIQNKVQGYIHGDSLYNLYGLVNTEKCLAFFRNL